MLIASLLLALCVSSSVVGLCRFPGLKRILWGLENIDIYNVGFKDIFLSNLDMGNCELNFDDSSSEFIAIFVGVDFIFFGF